MGAYLEKRIQQEADELDGKSAYNQSHRESRHKEQRHDLEQDIVGKYGDDIRHIAAFALP